MFKGLKIVVLALAIALPTLLMPVFAANGAPARLEATRENYLNANGTQQHERVRDGRNVDGLRDGRHMDGVRNEYNARDGRNVDGLRNGRHMDGVNNGRVGTRTARNGHTTGYNGAYRNWVYAPANQPYHRNNFANRINEGRHIYGHTINNGVNGYNNYGYGMNGGRALNNHRYNNGINGMTRYNNARNAVKTRTNVYKTYPNVGNTMRNATNRVGNEVRNATNNVGNTVRNATNNVGNTVRNTTNRMSSGF